MTRRSLLVRLFVVCAAGVGLLTGCTADTADATVPATAPADTTAAAPMILTVSAVTDEPTTVWFDVLQRSRTGRLDRSVEPTPVELSPLRPAVVLAVPYEQGSWMWARVSGPPDRPESTTVGCELVSATGRVLDAEAYDPFGPPPGEVACGGSQ